MRAICILIALIIGSDVYAQTVIWQKNIPGVGSTIDVNLTSDSIIFGSGFKEAPANSVYPFSMRSSYFKYDLDGNMIWRTHGRWMWDVETYIREKADGDFIIVGPEVNADSTLTALAPDRSDVFLLGMSAQGDTTTNHLGVTFPNPSFEEEPTDLLVMDNGDYIFTSSHADTAQFDNTPTSNYYSIHVRRTDSLGNTIWFKKFNEGTGSYPGNMVLSTSGDIVISGYYTLNARPYIPYVIKLTPNGDTIQTKKYVLQSSTHSAYNYSSILDLINTSDGGFAFTGNIVDSANTLGEGFMMKLDSNLVTQWVFYASSTTTSHVNASDLTQLADSSYLMLAKEYYLPNQTSENLIHLDKSGNLLSKTTFGIPICGTAVAQTAIWGMNYLPDSSIIFSGSCRFPFPNAKAFLARVSFANTLLNDKPTVKEKLLAVFPNPTTSSLTFTYPFLQSSAHLTLTDALSRIVMEQILPSGSSQFTTDISQLPEAVYFYQLGNDSQALGSGKVVVAR